jgi:hypothetical protein
MSYVISREVLGLYLLFVSVFPEIFETRYLTEYLPGESLRIVVEFRDVVLKMRVRDADLRISMLYLSLDDVVAEAFTSSDLAAEELVSSNS